MGFVPLWIGKFVCSVLFSIQCYYEQRPQQHQQQKSIRKHEQNKNISNDVFTISYFDAFFFSLIATSLIAIAVGVQCNVFVFVCVCACVSVSAAALSVVVAVATKYRWFEFYVRCKHSKFTFVFLYRANVQMIIYVCITLWDEIIMHRTLSYWQSEKDWDHFRIWCIHYFALSNAARHFYWMHFAYFCRPSSLALRWICDISSMWVYLSALFWFVVVFYRL